MLITSESLWLANTNCYLIATERGGTAVAVDAPPDPDAILRLAKVYDLTVVALLVTHGHIDHVGGAGSVHRATGATVYVHRDDDYLTLEPLAQLKSLFGMAPPGDFAPPDQITDLHHGQRLQLGGIDLEVRHTPGHTPGHCCFYIDEEGVLMSGDQLFRGSVGRTDLPGGSWKALIASMHSEVLTLPDEVRVLPGHGPETTIGVERRTNPFITGRF